MQHSVFFLNLAIFYCLNLAKLQLFHNLYHVFKRSVVERLCASDTDARGYLVCLYQTPKHITKAVVFEEVERQHVGKKRQENKIQEVLLDVKWSQRKIQT